MALISIPNFGLAPSFNEDEFGRFTSPGKLMTGTDESPSYPQEIVIICKNKQLRVCAPLGGALQLGATAEWEEMFGGGIASVVGGVIGTANNVLQWAKGQTLQQPWMNRKIYKNTKPFSFTLPLTFVTPVGEDSGEWVVKPCLALLSLLYPREVYVKSANGTYTKQRAGGDQLANSMTESVKKLQGTMGKEQTADKSAVIPAALSALNFYAIPGPSLKQNATDEKGKPVDSDEQGDSVNILAGNLFNFSNCYVTNVSLAFSESFDANGFPIAAKVNLQATCADQVVCKSDGNFIVNEFNDSAKSMDKFISAANIAGKHAKDNLLNIFKTTIGFYHSEKSEDEKGGD